DIGDRFFIRLLSQHDERYGAAVLEEICEKAGSLSIAGFMLEQNQAVVASLQHGLSLFEGTGVIELRQQGTAMALENLANEEKVFLTSAGRGKTACHRGITFSSGSFVVRSLTISK